MELIKAWSAEQREALRADVPRLGLKAAIGGRSVREIASDVLALARAGLARRGKRDAAGRDETAYLAPLEEIVAEGRTLAERRLEAYHGAWAGDLDRAFVDCVL
jgi:glutamate--cysteine ligase